MPFSLKAWVCFCAALEFTKHSLQDEPAGICGICLQFQAWCFSTARSSEPRTLLEVQLHFGKGAEITPWVLPAGMGFGAASRLVFLSCCPV